MATYTQQQQNFLATELPLAQRESKRTGIPVSVFLTQSWLETGAGTSGWFRNQNNPAGIGVTGAAGAGLGFASLSAAFRDYADKLLGIGEAGQEKFAADVKAHASPLQLLQDLEASPWAGGHYGGTAANPGHGLEQLWASQGLGAFDAPGAKAPSGGTPIQTVAYVPGTHVHIPTSPAGGAIDPLKSSAVGDLTSGVFGPVIDFIKQGAIRASLVIFGAVAILVGLALLVRDASQDHQADAAGRTAGREASAEEHTQPPDERTMMMTPPAPHPPAHHGPALQQSAPAGGGQNAGGAVSSDVSSTAKGAEELAAG